LTLMGCSSEPSAVIDATSPGTTPDVTTPEPTTADTVGTTSDTAPTATDVPPTVVETTSGPADTAAAESQGPDPAVVEAAFMDGTGCMIDDQFGRDLDGIRFLTTGLGPTEPDAPNEVVDGSFTCEVSPRGTASFGAARFGDAGQAAEQAAWFMTARICRPVATVGPWMLIAARPADQLQPSDELEQVVAELGGQLVATCR
jgi:hypothetical protein